MDTRKSGGGKFNKSLEAVRETFTRIKLGPDLGSELTPQRQSGQSVGGYLVGLARIRIYFVNVCKGTRSRAQNLVF